MDGGQHDRQAANLLHRRIEVQQGMAPIDATGNRPLSDGSAPASKASASDRYRPRESARVAGDSLGRREAVRRRHRADRPSCGQKLRHGYRLAREVGLSGYCVRAACVNRRDYAPTADGKLEKVHLVKRHRNSESNETISPTRTAGMSAIARKRRGAGRGCAREHVSVLGRFCCKGESERQYMRCLGNLGRQQRCNYKEAG
jgi:hypothetical protein